MAMAPNFVISGKFNSYNFAEQSKIKELIEAQTEQGDMEALKIPRQFREDVCSEKALSTKEAMSNFTPSRPDAEHFGNMFVPDVKKLDQDQLLAEIDGMINARSKPKEIQTVLAKNKLSVPRYQPSEKRLPEIDSELESENHTAYEGQNKFVEATMSSNSKMIIRDVSSRNDIHSMHDTFYFGQTDSIKSNFDQQQMIEEEKVPEADQARET